MELRKIVVIECQGESQDSCAGCAFFITENGHGCNEIRQALGLSGCYARGTIFQIKSADKVPKHELEVPEENVKAFDIQENLTDWKV